jgi:hypothetical protein
MPPEVFQLLLEKGAGDVVRPSEELLNATALGNRLPAEVMEMVRREGADGDGLMTREEASKHRLALMDERSAFVKANEGEWKREYSFCEH